MFNGISDIPGTIKIEGEKISVDFLPAQPQSGQGTVRWNIPTPIDGCLTRSTAQSAYCGIVVVASLSPLSPENIPVDGTRYEPDPSLNADIHCGDRIGDALVIGAFYEGEQKAAGEDLTTELIVDDLNSDIVYYVGVYAVSCTLQYHRDGIRAYSDILGNAPTQDIPSVSAVIIDREEGIMATDGTGLESGRKYSLEFDLNNNFPNDSNENNRISVSFDGADAQTYGDMIDVLNDQFKDVDNPLRSSQPPNTGSYLWNATERELSRYNGIDYDPVDDLIINSTDPAVTPVGSYWLDEVTKQLRIRNSNVLPSLELWDDIITIVSTTDPTDPTCSHTWFDGKEAFEWSGTTWCAAQTFTQTTDPSLMRKGICGQYWYDTTLSMLHRYNIETCEWEERLAIFWPTSPDALPAGTLWFSTTDRALRSRIQFGQVNDWNLETNFVIAEIEPRDLSQGLFWYRESTSEFFQYNNGNFDVIDVLEWHEDPSSITSCELWWDSDTDDLHEFDVVHLQWDVVSVFNQSPEDPLNPEEIDEVSYWLDSVTNTLNIWNGSHYMPVMNYIDFPTDPTLITDSTVVAWFNPANNIVQIPTSIEGQVWNLTESLVVSEYDPERIPIGKSWFDSSNDTLMFWNGVMWINVPYTSKPIRNVVGDLWCDTNTNTLKTWNGMEYVPAMRKITASIDSRGNIRFTTRDTGSCISLLMLIPGEAAQFVAQRRSGLGVTFTGSTTHSVGFRNVYTENPFEMPRYLDSTLREDEFLFNQIENAIVQPVVIGTDSLETSPAYTQLGVGTDGTPDERRDLMHTVRVRLGFPTVEVELTDEQIDVCITKAFEELRLRSDVAYRRGFFLLDLRPGVQSYQMTNKKIGFNKIVTIMGAHRRSGAFSGGYSSNSVFDQLFSQQLFGGSSAGGFDMTSLFLSQQYLELIEMMFATRLNFHFNESDRTLHFHQDFHRHERILLDTTTERTEQELLVDRWSRSWIERYTLAGARLILAEVRGKYASLPGAGGGISLNATDLLTQSAADFQECYNQLDDFIASNAEHFGAHDFVIG